MISKYKIVLFLIILVSSGDIFTFKYNVVKYRILNNKKLQQNQSTLSIIKSLNNPDLMDCLMSCSENCNCNAAVKTLKECQLINVVGDSNLIQDNQAKIYLKNDSLKFTIWDNKTSNYFNYKIFI